MTAEFPGYPAWLGQGLLGTDFPWHLAQVRSFSPFLEQYSLHGSRWIGLFTDVAYGQSVTLVLDWNPASLPPSMRARLDSPHHWLFLLIRLEEVEQISLSGYEDLLPGVKLQRTIATAEYTALDGKQLFALQDRAEGTVAIIFSGAIALLALDESGDPVSLV
ncbi:MAG: hypothetical protein VKJ24_14540 [Synechococcales bacterium]|nr:hypothetical protein [Synechococcales bacterium]